MANGFNKNLMAYNSEAVLNIESAATFLGISAATVRNWVKCGYLQTLSENTKRFFHKKDIEDVKSKILNGNLEKLNKRANKAKADRTFVPDEYMQDKAGLEELNVMITFIKNNNIDLSSALLLISLNLLQKEKIVFGISIRNIIQKKDLSITNKQIKEEIKSWLSEIEEGKIKKNSKVLDPCCGTGQFLLAFSDVIEDPLNIYGIDFDQIAVRIARLNILIKFKNKNFAPNIICKNTLFDIGSYDLFSLNDENIRDFNVIATNPPWGVHFSKVNSERLKRLYPMITSLESFSYFLKKSIDLLHDNGVMSFILPESILNVKTHKDIREIILKNTQIEKIVYLDRVFKNVFTPVIRLDLKKSQIKNNKVKIQKENASYEVEQLRWIDNQDFIFDIHASSFDAEIIDKVYKTKNTTLENKADWALGIVTGNNNKFIVDEPKEGFEPIYKGKDVGKFILKNPLSFIQFAPEKFQQVAPIEKYRAKEKLIYRFISKNLVFSYDNKRRLTLNSANIIIPKIPDYPIKVIAALLNSSLYQFIFRKKFSSIKVLRSHIEQMPLPLWSEKILSNIIKLADKTIENKNNFGVLDDYIMEKYALSLKEINYIKNFNNK